MIHAAEVVVAEMLAAVVDQQVPVVVLDEHRGLVVQEIPADVLEVLPRGGRFDRQGEVSTALGGAIIAQDVAGREVLARGLSTPSRSGAFRLRFHDGRHPGLPPFAGGNRRGFAGRVAR
jgi:hypothetical protein